MQNYHVRLQADVSKSYRATRAANSLDIDVEKKSIHELQIQADLKTPFNIGLIVGASGSGKTTLARQIFGADCFREYLDLSKPIIDQLPADLSYDDCAASLNGIGLSQVPCWIRSAHTLSNGQRARAEALLAMLLGGEQTVIDEWTSVVDRTVAKAMSFCLQKYARRTGKKIVLLSCHYDVMEWLDPDWVIDCNTGTYIDRRSLQRGQREEQLQFDIREIDGKSWRNFAKYHYLSETLPGGKVFFFGLFHGENQIGFQCFANYVPVRKEHADKRMMMHSNRTVIHPDYVGFGLGMKLIDETSAIIAGRGYRVMAKFSSTPVYRAMSKSPHWRLRAADRHIGRNLGFIKTCSLNRKDAIRSNLLIYSFEYIGPQRA